MGLELVGKVGFSVQDVNARSNKEPDTVMPQIRTSKLIGINKGQFRLKDFCNFIDHANECAAVPTIYVEESFLMKENHGRSTF